MSAATGDPAALLLAPALAAADAERETVARVASRVADRLADGGHLYTFGAGHSWAFAAELCSRAGGLRPITAMNLDDLRDTPRPAWRQLADSMPERDPANGPALLDRYDVGGRDCLLIASQSGRNGASVAMAEQARRDGVYTVAVLSKAHCAAYPSRHPSGRKLPEVVDDVIDNHCPIGDAAVPAPDGGRVGAASTVSFALLAQLLVVEIGAALHRRGRTAEVIVSANVDAPTR
ncbi:sugar isomerase domain-containing protein [Micromonospora sp. NBS 11-29]|uniref:sugar isomerase domain-containing protein n=1 Tax=Micromonospora sp. NBS 11-29 TaxID=1960879 RepID=UPI000B785950|nr:sugar isomerase domain-containing protein [Micromonospora sp. NBS 11-29]